MTKEEERVIDNAWIAIAQPDCMGATTTNLILIHDLSPACASVSPVSLKQHLNPCLDPMLTGDETSDGAQPPSCRHGSRIHAIRHDFVHFRIYPASM